MEERCGTQRKEELEKKRGKEILRKKGMAVSLNEGNAGRGTNTGN